MVSPEMATMKPQRREKLDQLEYILDDALALKARLNRQKRKPLVKFLLTAPLDGLRIEAVEGFRLAKNLVIFDGSDSAKVTHLIFIRPGDGRFSVKKLHSSRRPTDGHPRRKLR